MALQDSLLVTTDLNEKQLAQFFFECMGIEVEMTVREGNIHDRMVIAEQPEQFQVFVRPLDPGRRLRPPMDPGANMVLDFHLFYETYRAVEEKIMWATVEMARKTTWDLVLVHQDSNIIFLRRDGKLLLKKGVLFWTPERLNMIGLPFEMADIPEL